MSLWSSKFNKYVGHYAKYQNQNNFNVEPENHIKVIDSDIGRNVGFERVAVHHVVLPAHARTSSPHAESLEEEFVYVISGQVDLWQNGYIHHLNAGHAVGFPAGTGIAHTFINNTDSEVHLIVAGETGKEDNLCSFPINPELKESCGIWWDKPPLQKLGTHNGLPGKVSANEVASELAANIIYCPDQKKRGSFNYPGDNESFGCGFRVTNEVGLKALGISYECLEPGKRSAFPHAHTHEEEFVYVLRGQPTVFMNGYVKQLSAGEFAAFPSNTGIAHAIINDTDEDIYYICIGEAEEFTDEKIYYPFNPLRNKECERIGWLWKDVPKHNYGLHTGFAKKEYKDHLKFKLCTKESAIEVLKIFNDSPDFFKKTEGCLPNLKLTEQFIVDTPNKKSMNYFKEFLIIEYNNENIGVLDIHVNHPEDQVCYIGLLLLKENLSGSGLGTRCFKLAEDYIKNATKCQKVRLGVSLENDVSGFWKKLGFKSNGNSYVWKGEQKDTLVNEFDKII